MMGWKIKDKQGAGTILENTSKTSKGKLLRFPRDHVGSTSISGFILKEDDDISFLRVNSMAADAVATPRTRTSSAVMFI